MKMMPEIFQSIPGSNRLIVFCLIVSYTNHFELEFVTVCDNLSSLHQTGNDRVFIRCYNRLVPNLPTLGGV